MTDLENQLSELLKKNAWTEEEKRWVLNYLESSDAGELHDLMKQQFTNSGSQLDPDLSQQLLHSIHERLGIEEPRKKASVVKMWVWRIAVAASVLLVIGLGWKFFTGSKKESTLAKQTEDKTDSLVFVIHHEMNTTGKEKRFQLPDGSLIVLADKSEITYREPFVNSRDITLIGKAYFKVMHDQTRPFIVTSGDLTTTDLGTEFTVTSFKNTHQVIVRLYEGRVVVKAVKNAITRMNKDVYLLPGQQFVYSDQTVAKVKTFKVMNAAPEQIMEAEIASDNPLLPKDVDAPWFMFNNQPLENVLNDLAALYNVGIVYDKKDIQNTYFTGKYNKSESLENILKRICTLNNLTITKKDSAFIISK